MYVAELGQQNVSFITANVLDGDLTSINFLKGIARSVPLAGATVTVTGPDGKSFKGVTARNGQVKIAVPYKPKTEVTVAISKEGFSDQVQKEKTGPTIGFIFSSLGRSKPGIKISTIFFGIAAAFVVAALVMRK